MSLPSLDKLYDRLSSSQDGLRLVEMSPVESILRTVFPARIQDYETREPQIRMATLIESVLTNHEHVIAEAGTGTGKSIGYLVPLHLHLSKIGGRAIVSTGTIALQEQLMAKDIPMLESVMQTNFKARLAKGKSNYLCQFRLENEINQIGMFKDDPQTQQLLNIEEWAHRSQTGDRADLPVEPLPELWTRLCADDNCTGKRCPKYSGCFVTRAKERLKDSQIIVCNHALFMLDIAYQHRILPDYRIVVLDEAHKLEGIARAALSRQCSIFRLPMLLKQARKVSGMDYNLCEDAQLQNDAFFHTAAAMEKADRFRLKPTNQLINQGNILLQLTEKIARTEPSNDHDEIVLGNVQDFFDDLVYILSAEYRDRNVYWVEKSRTVRGAMKVVLNGTPVNVAPMLANMLFGEMDSVILTSATLSAGGKFDYLKNNIGCNSARELMVESPFEYSEQCLLYLPEMLPEPNSINFHEQISPIISDLLSVTDGRALVLFTSYRGMNEVYSRLGGKLPYRLLKQGDMPKRALLNAFRDDVHSVLLATSSFWEGVDIQGESLSCVIIDKLPFSVPDDPISQAKAESIKKRGGNVFAQMSLPEAILSLKQGFGRLIRTRSDRGVVCILDSRLSTKGYGKVFLRSLPGARVVRSLDEVEEFMEEVGE